MNSIALQLFIFAYLVAATAFILVVTEKDEEIIEFKKNSPTKYAVGMLIAIAILPLIFVIVRVKSLL